MLLLCLRPVCHWTHVVICYEQTAKRLYAFAAVDFAQAAG